MVSNPFRNSSLLPSSRAQNGQQRQQQPQPQRHQANGSQSTSVQARGAGASLGAQISHRPSSSLDRTQHIQKGPGGSAAPNGINAAADSPSTSKRPPPGAHGPHVAGFPAGYSVAGYGQSGRGVKNTGMGWGLGMDLNRHMDDNASLASLIMDRDASNSYDGHASDSGHSFSSHGNHLTPPFSGKPLREKTSFTHLKNSEHKILSNEEKYNAYVVPGVPQYDGPEADDALHDPGPRLKGLGPDRRLADSRTIHGSRAFISWRGLLNVIGLGCILVPMVGFFAVYPVVSYVINFRLASQSMYTNATGQVPDITNFRGLVDRDTPTDVYTKTGVDGNEYTLVFSDEFNQDGRTFYEGDDPYWTAVDMHYYSTGDVEWYDPQAITTQDGYLVINLTEVADPSTNHNLSYMSGMLQGWNQFCFTGGIVEASVSIPGTADVTGLWPAFWSMGNLGRAGYGSTLDGTWPYSYDSCDAGTLPNQTDFTKMKTPWMTSDGYVLSYLPGQKLSACTCSGEDHPGPNHKVGRAAPELDVFEALVNPTDFDGEISQTLQIAPFDMDYLWDNTSDTYSVSKTYKTFLNTYHGSNYQESCSALSLTDQQSYYLVDQNSFQTYSYEYMPSSGTTYDGYIHWKQGDAVTWSMQESGLVGNTTMDYSQRLVPREPMYMILNLGMAENFNTIDYKHLTFPAIMRFDWIRVYQRSDNINIGCDPKDFPTADYINRHVDAYTNYNLTVWGDAEPNGFPKNSLLDGC